MQAFPPNNPPPERGRSEGQVDAFSLARQEAAGLPLSPQPSALSPGIEMAVRVRMMMAARPTSPKSGKGVLVKASERPLATRGFGTLHDEDSSRRE